MKTFPMNSLKDAGNYEGLDSFTYGDCHYSLVWLYELEEYQIHVNNQNGTYTITDGFGKDVVAVMERWNDFRRVILARKLIAFDHEIVQGSL
jgi:hypothetical protein